MLGHLVGQRSGMYMTIRIFLLYSSLHYFPLDRQHYSKILKRELPEDDYTELPASWYTGLDVSAYLTSSNYRPKINRYSVKAGQSLDEWESAGWIHTQDPRGWFQWYCRFYLGRRTADDERQIKRCESSAPYMIDVPVD